MIELKGRFSVSNDRIEQIVADEETHEYYDIAKRRAQHMATWYAAEFDEFPTAYGTIFASKGKVIEQSTIESERDYKSKLDRIRLMPLESKFLSAQQRIYDENGVDRQYPEGSEKFWKWKEDNFDDQGATITEFYRDKVLYVKETLGFGAVITDIMMDDEGNPIVEEESSEVVPYNYVVLPHELYNFEIRQGQLLFLVIRQWGGKDENGHDTYEWRVFTPDEIKIYHQDVSAPKLQKTIDNPFGEVPATILKGQVDPSSYFKIGKPRRYALKGLYKAATELFYDLQKGSELFAHPIPAYSESIAKSLAGVTKNQNGDEAEYDAQKIKEEVGMIVIYPDDMEMPSQLFYQADMGGLQHLRDVIFKDLMGLIFTLAKVRDKSIQKSNVSGDAKAFDSVEEQGLLSQTAQDMQDIEEETTRRMAKVRNEKPEDFTTNYSKHYDLSSADELWDDFTTGQQYGGVPYGVQKYQLTEYLRKRSAPQETIDDLVMELNSTGLPLKYDDVDKLVGVIDDALLQAKLNPQLMTNEARMGLIDTREQILAMRASNPEVVETQPDEEEEDETGIDSEEEQD